MMVLKMSRLMGRWALQAVLVFMFVTLLLMVFMSRVQHDDYQQLISKHKEQAKEQIRLKKLHALQKTIFKNPKRPLHYTYNINVSLSEQTPLEREIPESRPEKCRTRQYDIDSLPTLSVVIPFYNEALSMLLRTVHSILNRTPDKLLREIILVNDNSPNADLKEPLEEYVKLLPDKVILLRTKFREGLIRARMIGARLATGECIMFQDAHTENNVGWAEPLLDEIRKDRSTIIQPFVEQVEAWTIRYNPASGVVPRGGFSWDLRYTWMEIPEHELNRINYDDSVPFRTATLVGCALMVHKEYFLSIGGFDDGMNVWGGENLELAFRNWMCGGRVLTNPCSRVAHVFKPFSYKFDGDREKIVQKNLMRIAELWMGDPWKQYFYAATYSWDFKHTFFTEKDLISLEKRREIKKKFNCKSFDWYQKVIVPEIPMPPRNAHYYGEPANEKSEACWHLTEDGYVDLTSFCFFHRVVPQNIFHITDKGRLMYRKTCIRVEPSTWLLKEGPCQKKITEIWDVMHTEVNNGLTRVRMEHHGEMKELCAMQVTNINKVHHREQMPQMAPCDFNNPFQHWRWTYKFNFDYNFDKPL